MCSVTSGIRAVSLLLFWASRPSYLVIVFVLAWAAAAPARAVDSDADGYDDLADNCPLQPNASQLDTDLDGFGNACDPDYDNDFDVDGIDFFGIRGVFGAGVGDPLYDEKFDADGDGVISGPDFLLFRGMFGGPPGPSIAELEGIYYVDPVVGDDETTGAIDRPWRTLQAAFDRLRPGDTLVLRDGTYFESEVSIRSAGTAGAPILVRNHVGESPVVDGGLLEFRTAGNADWELFDASRGIYRSAAIYPGLEQAHGYLDTAGQRFHLVPYETWGHFASDNQRYTATGNIYVGHGVYWNPIDSRIYVRLVPSELQLFLGYPDPPALDPRLVSIHVFANDEVLIFEWNSAYVTLEGIDVQFQNNAVEIRGGAREIEIRDADLLGGRTHVLIRDGAHHLVFDDVRVVDSIPPWIAWEDVKAGTEPAADFQGAAFAIQDAAYNVEISNCLVENVFDAVDATATPHDLVVRDCEFRGIRDDVIQIGTAGYNYEIHDNRMLGVSKGVSRNGSGDTPAPGTTWIHHNVIDAGTLMQYGRQNPDGTWHGKADPGMNGQVWAAPFGSHGGTGYGAGQAWKIYHNTIVLGKALGSQGAGQARFWRPGALTEVFNNVFVQLTDDRVARSATAEGGVQVFDGNLYHRLPMSPTTDLFASFEPAGGGASEDFADLATFVGSAFQLSTQAAYAPGWEAGSVEADPQLDSEYRPLPTGPAASGAIALPAGFPGDAGETFRGALAPGPGS